ncbi:Retrotransposon-derived protein PEG10 [Labeo rohita]|uniref:Retrotransposon-derived protein PEG10 n=1 Tax=Labeo rohita TaxID=84645 RepID=A0ABQ8M1B0_LABRO|nr:Retrotransposon-derived protein PEG10 [Labeo rohita]
MDPHASDPSLQKTSPSEDPAAVYHLSTEVSAQAAMLATHQQQLQRLTSLTEELVRTLQSLRVTEANVRPAEPPQPPAASNQSTTSPRLAFPEKFDGSPEKCKGFLRRPRIMLSHFAHSLHKLAGQRILSNCFIARGLPQNYSPNLVCCDEDKTLDVFIDLSIRIDNLVCSRRPPHQSPMSSQSATAVPDSDPMQIGFTHLTAEERERRIRQHLCLYCGQPGHLRVSCPTRPPNRKTSAESSMAALDGRPLGEGHVKFIIDDLVLQTGALHTETLRLFTINSPRNPIILGLPWLEKHNPRISWTSRQILQCILAEAFSKTKATKLPPHRANDCAIDLIPGSVPPKGRIFPLSQPESEAMRAYTEEELAKGFIRPSTSPASVGFFFIKNKDGGLRPCIDYRGLNEITIKFRYPLPLVPFQCCLQL